MNILPNTLCRSRIVRPMQFLILAGILCCRLSISGASAQASVARTAPGQPQAANALPPVSNAPHDVLSDDARLGFGVSLVHRRITIADALKELAAQAHVAVVADGKEIQLSEVALSVRGAPLRDVLRSLAALNGLQWRRTVTPDGQAVLLLGEPDDPHWWDFLRPTTQASADEHRAVRDFQSQFASLPPQMQQALSVPHRGIPFSDLPAGMQQAVRDALTARMVTLSALHATWNMPFRPQITPDTINSQQVIFRAEPGDGLTEYRLDLEAPGFGSMGMVTSVPDDPRFRDIGDTTAPPGQPQYQAVRDEAFWTAFDKSREKAVKDDPRLSQVVSIKISDALLGFALAALADAAHVNIVAQVFNDTHTVSLTSVPLRDALNQIAAKYHAVWGEAPDGTILIHNWADKRPAAQQTAAE